MAGRTFRFHPAAEVELLEAARWYEGRRSGLGGEFVHVVRNKIEDILEAPERLPLSNGVRRALITKFPYAVVYRQVQRDQIEIVAVAHLKRRPKYWSPR